MNKKAGIIAIIILIIAVLFIAWEFFELIGRECHDDGQCNQNRYCGSDFKCHDHPVIHQNSYVLSSLILGIAIIVAVIIYKKLDLKKKNDIPTTQKHSILNRRSK